MFATLYSHISRFLLRALEYYEEGSWKRALHAVTKPAALRYNGIIKDIHRTTDAIAAHATAGSQAEQRDIHEQFLAAHQMIEGKASSNTAGQAKIPQKLQQLHDLITATRAEHAEISRSVFSIQSTQALHVIYSQYSIDHQSCLQMSIGLRNHHHHREKLPSGEPLACNHGINQPLPHFFPSKCGLHTETPLKTFVQISLSNFLAIN
jgi:hypothetical protein